MGARSQLKEIDQGDRQVVADNLTRIRASCEYEGMSDREFFQRLLVPRTAIRNVLAAGIGVNIDTLAAIAGGLGLSPWMLLVPGFDPGSQLTLPTGSKQKAAAAPSKRRVVA